MTLTLTRHSAETAAEAAVYGEGSLQSGLDGDTLAILLELTATEAGTDINADYLAETLGEDTAAKTAAIAYCAQHGISLSEPWMDADGKVMPPVVRGWSRLRIDDATDTYIEVSHIAANVGTRRGEMLSMSLIVMSGDYLHEAVLVGGGSIDPAEWLHSNIYQCASYDFQLLSDWLGCQIPQDWGMLPAISHHTASDPILDWQRGKLSATLIQQDGTETAWEHSLAEVHNHYLSSLSAMSEFAAEKAEAVAVQFSGFCHIIITHPRAVGVSLVGKTADYRESVSPTERRAHNDKQA